MRVRAVLVCFTLVVVSACAFETRGVIGASRDSDSSRRAFPLKHADRRASTDLAAHTDLPLARLGNSAHAQGALPVTHFGDEDKFPSDFVFGVATSAFQVEGDGGDRPSSIWDDFADEHGLGNAARQGIRHWEHVRDDVKYMARAGVKHYRFSLSWPRLQHENGEPNEQGYAFYEKLLKALAENGIQPYVTLHHWDLPAKLCGPSSGGVGDGDNDDVENSEKKKDDDNGVENSDKNGVENSEKKCGPVDWRDPRSVAQFTKYATQVFERLGDKVKFWTTLNEPKTVADLGYGAGQHAPGVVSTTAPLVAGHNMLLAHAFAVKAYREKFQETQTGKISINVNSDWREPLDATNEKHVAAAERAMDEQLGWFADPLYFGDYPASMKTRLGEDLPNFTPEESALLKGSTDYFALNHYASQFVVDAELSPANSYLGRPTDWTETSVDSSGTQIGPTGSCHWLTQVPFGLEKTLKLISERYASPETFVTENGVCADGNGGSLDEQLNDETRVNFFNAYLKSTLNAVKQSANVKGYFAWSFFDNFEWADGTAIRFGMVHVDHGGDFGGEWSARRGKESLRNYREFMLGKHSGNGGVTSRMGEETISRLKELREGMDDSFYGVFDWETDRSASEHVEAEAGTESDTVVATTNRNGIAALGASSLGRRGLSDRKSKLGEATTHDSAKEKVADAYAALAAAVEALRQAETSITAPGPRDPEAETLLAQAELVLSQAERPRTDALLATAEQVLAVAKRDDAVAHGALDVRKADATGSVNAFFALDDGANSQNFATNGANRGGYSMDDPLWRNTAKKHLEYFISMKPVWMATVTGVLFGLFLIAIQVACNLARQKGGKACGANEGEVKSLVPGYKKAKASFGKDEGAKYGAK